ncbi:MAG: hypothetical protein ACLFT4_03220 [Bacteroidales bacterium]
MGQLLDKKALLQRDNLTIEKVEFEDGNHVFVRQMTGRERDKWEQSLMREVKRPNGQIDYERSLDDFRAKLAVCTVCDEKGKLLLNFNDYNKLSENMSAFKLEKIVNVAQKLNKISEEDRENLSKSSEETQADNSTSDSVEN